MRFFLLFPPEDLKHEYYKYRDLCVHEFAKLWSLLIIPLGFLRCVFAFIALDFLAFTMGLIQIGLGIVLILGCSFMNWWLFAFHTLGFAAFLAYTIYLGVENMVEAVDVYNNFIATRLIPNPETGDDTFNKIMISFFNGIFKFLLSFAGLCILNLMIRATQYVRIVVNQRRQIELALRMAREVTEHEIVEDEEAETVVIENAEVEESSENAETCKPKKIFKIVKFTNKKAKFEIGENTDNSDLDDAGDSDQNLLESTHESLV